MSIVMDIKNDSGDAAKQRSAMPRGVKPQSQMHSRQRLKNWALALLLVGLAVLFYFVTIVRFGHHG